MKIKSDVFNEALSRAVSRVSRKKGFECTGDLIRHVMASYILWFDAGGSYSMNEMFDITESTRGLHALDVEQYSEEDNYLLLTFNE